MLRDCKACDHPMHPELELGYPSRPAGICQSCLAVQFSFPAFADTGRGQAARETDPIYDISNRKLLLLTALAWSSPALALIEHGQSANFSP
jgi:hypothetical protein